MPRPSVNRPSREGSGISFIRAGRLAVAGRLAADEGNA
jgi:hypothetical protein